MEEIWKDVVGYEGIYQVSNLGNVKGLLGCGNRKKGLLSFSYTSKGYLKVALCKNGKQRTARVHHLVAQAFLYKQNEEYEVNHKNGIKTDNRVENLEWVSHTENMRHALKTGLIIRKKGNICQKTIDAMAKSREKKIQLIILGEPYKVFESIIKASKELKIGKKTIINFLKKRCKPNKIYDFDYVN